MLNFVLRSVTSFSFYRFSLNNHQLICSRTVMQNGNRRFKVRVLPALKDNYMYLLIDNVKRTGIAVDPVEPNKILDCLNEENATLKAVLTTHHHFDHAGGNALLCQKIKNIPVYGGDDRIEALSNKLTHNEIFQVDGIGIKCLHTPCHTSGHVCYFIESDNPICFTGDTLFIGGCGRFFEGSAEHMYNSLNVICTLPLNTKLYCGHEYTINNLKFALFIEPSNHAILKRLNDAENSLAMMEPTVPSTIEEELSFNPFLRVHVKEVQKSTQEIDPVAVMKVLRDLKDNFKPGKTELHSK